MLSQKKDLQSLLLLKQKHKQKKDLPSSSKTHQQSLIQQMDSSVNTITSKLGLVMRATKLTASNHHSSNNKILLTFILIKNLLNVLQKTSQRYFLLVNGLVKSKLKKLDPTLSPLDLMMDPTSPSTANKSLTTWDATELEQEKDRLLYLQDGMISGHICSRMAEEPK